MIIVSISKLCFEIKRYVKKDMSLEYTRRSKYKIFESASIIAF